jgi:hypothetical protein
VNNAINPSILVYWSASDAMAFTYLPALRTNQSGVANLDGIAKVLGQLAKNQDNYARNLSENIS